jgi:hypothetical protein
MLRNNRSKFPGNNDQRGNSRYIRGCLYRFLGIVLLCANGIFVCAKVYPGTGLTVDEIVGISIASTVALFFLISGGPSEQDVKDSF